MTSTFECSKKWGDYRGIMDSIPLFYLIMDNSLIDFLDGELFQHF